MINWNWFFTWSLATVASCVLGITGIAGKNIVRYVYEDEGNCVILNCTCTSVIGGTWVGPGKPMISSEQSKDDLISYTEGSVLNPYLNLTNINFYPNIATGECNLEITNFSRFDEGTYKCQNSKDRVYVFNVFVKNPPKVTVAYNLTNGTLDLQCSPSGVPNNYTFLKLEQRSEFNENIRFLNSSYDGSVLRTSIINAGLQDTGIYICKVSNGVPDQNGRKFQSGKTLVELEDAPIFLGGDIFRYAKIGEVISISAVFYNRYEMHSITTIQSKRNIMHKLKVNRSFVKVHKVFHGSNITLNASQVSFQLDIRTRKDFTKYILKICNPFGCRDIKIDIRMDTSRISGNTEKQHHNLESVFAAVAVLSVLGLGMTIVFFIRKRVKDEIKRQTSRIEDSDEDTPRQSIANELYQSEEFVNSDNPEHLLKATESGGYVYHATSSLSLREPTSNNQAIKQASARNYEIKTRNTIEERKQISIEIVE